MRHRADNTFDNHFITWRIHAWIANNTSEIMFSSRFDSAHINICFRFRLQPFFKRKYQMKWKINVSLNYKENLPIRWNESSFCAASTFAVASAVDVIIIVIRWKWTWNIKALRDYFVLSVHLLISVFIIASLYLFSLSTQNERKKIRTNEKWR